MNAAEARRFSGECHTGAHRCTWVREGHALVVEVDRPALAATSPEIRRERGSNVQSRGGRPPRRSRPHPPLKTGAAHRATDETSQLQRASPRGFAWVPGQLVRLLAARDHRDQGRMVDLLLAQRPSHPAITKNSRTVRDLHDFLEPVRHVDDRLPLGGEATQLGQQQPGLLGGRAAVGSSRTRTPARRPSLGDLQVLERPDDRDHGVRRDAEPRQVARGSMWEPNRSRSSRARACCARQRTRPPRVSKPWPMAMFSATVISPNVEAC